MRLPLLGSVAVLVTALAWSVQAQAKDDIAPAAAPAPKVAPPGFVHIPAGKVEAGCGMKSLQDRSNKGKNEAAWNAIMLELWGQPPAVTLPEFFIGKYTITNAQWKHYLDREFRVDHVCTGSDTLESLASKYVLFRGAPVAAEWRSIYGLNANSIVVVIKKADADAITKCNADAKKADAEGKKQPKPKPHWGPKWTLQDPDPFNK